MKRKVKISNIRSILFKRYFVSTVMICMAIVLIIFMYLYMLSYNQVITSQQSMCNSIDAAMNQRINELDSAVMDLIYSNTLSRDLRSRQMSSNREINSTNGIDNGAAQCASDILSIKGFNESIRQLNVYDSDYIMMGAGSYDGYYACDPDKISWLSSSTGTNGKTIVTSIHSFEWIPNYRGRTPKISIVREYRPYLLDQNMYYAEATSDCSVFFSFVQEAVTAPMSVLIYNQDGECIYPYSDQAESSGISPNDIYILANQMESDSSIRTTTGSGKRFIITKDDSSDDLRIVLISPYSIVFTAFQGMIPFIVFLILIALAVSFTTSFVLAKRISQSIYELSGKIQNLKFDSITENTPGNIIVSSDISEIVMLTGKINEMQKALVESAKREIAFSHEKTHSQLLALDAQMNPHFLYNNLTNISIMVEEGMNDQANRLCKWLCHMMRYTSSTAETVYLLQEIDHAKEYFYCLDIRYGDNIQMSLDIPSDMEDIVVPKLIIEPFLENSAKYGLDTPPPWIFDVKGARIDNGWTITISDSGNGFSEKALSEIHSSIEEFRESQKMPSMQIQGMGIINIFIRMYLQYGDDVIFELGNKPEGGAFVRLGSRDYQKGLSIS